MAEFFGLTGSPKKFISVLMGFVAVVLARHLARISWILRRCVWDDGSSG